MSDKKLNVGGKRVRGEHVRGGYTPITQPANPRPPTGGTGESPRTGSGAGSNVSKK